MGASLIAAARREQVRQAAADGRLQAAYDDCSRRFSLFHVVGYIMHAEAVKAYDIMDEEGMVRHEVKRLWRRAETLWDGYQRMLRGMETDQWYLLQDYCDAAHEELESKCDLLAINVHNYLLKHKHKNAHVLSRLIVAREVGYLIGELWSMFFDKYKQQCGIDFSSKYAWADLSGYRRAIDTLMDELSRMNPTLQLGEDANCMAAYRVLTYRLGDDDYLDQAAHQALERSPRYQYLLDEMAQKKELPAYRASVPHQPRCEHMSHDSSSVLSASQIERLRTKYNVTVKEQA